MRGERKTVVAVLYGARRAVDPVSYEVDGKQYIFITAGNVYLAFALP